MAAANSINESTTGITGFTGTAFVGTPVTNHALIVGSSTSSTLTNVGPGTGGNLVVGVTGADPIFSTTVTGLTGDNKITFDTAVSGEARWLEVINNSNTASSTARIQATVAGGTAGDADFQAFLTGGQGWTWGLDNSDSDAWVLAASTALGSNNVMRVAATGEINYPLQPAFLAYLETSVLNVTGDGTEYTVIYDTEVFDQNSDFDLATSTFTAPVTGRYLINVSGSLIGGTVMTTIICRIVTLNRTYRITLPLNAGVTTSASGTGSVLADMDAADTFTISLQSTDSGGKIDDAAGTTGGQLRNWVSAQLSV